MTGPLLTSDQCERLARLAAALIPAARDMPAAYDVAGFSTLITNAARASGYTDQQVAAAVEGIPASCDLASAEAFAKTEPANFHIASTLVSAAYFMAPEILDKLGFPADRRQPAEVEDFVNEYETGILDAVTERGPRYRDVAGQTA
jgi:hypothetical protein